MNDRIKALAEQAGISWDDKYHWYVGAPQLQEYTKLVIQEALEQIDKMTDSFDETKEKEKALGTAWAGYAVARHFGLE